MAHILYILRKRREKADLRREWQYKLRDVTNPFELPEREFIKNFRLPKDATRDLIAEIKPYYSAVQNGYSVELQVLTCLHIMGSGSFQNVSANDWLLQISQASVSRFLKKMTEVLLNISKKHISFPTSFNEIQKSKLDFYRKFHFPNIIGAVDCTHVYIGKPKDEDSIIFLNRKSRYSINIQMICDSNLKIIDVVARWPGSTHDAFIWKFCGARHILSNGLIQQPAFLLGDSGYPLETWLLTPFRNPNDPSENTFNYRHASARNVIERCFGVLKSRFRLISDSGGILQYTPEKCCKMIIGIAVLHNICIKYNTEMNENLEYNHESDDEEEQDNDFIFPRNNTADLIRREIALRLHAAR